MSLHEDLALSDASEESVSPSSAKKFPCVVVQSSGQQCTRTCMHNSDLTLHVNRDHLFQRAFCADCRYLYTATRYGVTHMLKYKHRVLEVILIPGEGSEHIEVLATRFETRLPIKVLPTEKMARTKNTTCQHPESTRHRSITTATVATARHAFRHYAATVTSPPSAPSTPVASTGKVQISPARSSPEAPAVATSSSTRKSPASATATASAPTATSTPTVGWPIPVITSPPDVELSHYPWSPSPDDLIIDEGNGHMEQVATVTTAPSIFMSSQHTSLTDPAIRKSTTPDRLYAGRKCIAHSQEILPVPRTMASRLLKSAKIRKHLSQTVAAAASLPHPVIRLTTLGTSLTTSTTTVMTAITTPTPQSAALVTTTNILSLATASHASSSVTNIPDRVIFSGEISASVVHPPRPSTTSCGTQTRWGNFTADMCGHFCH